MSGFDLSAIVVGYRSAALLPRWQETMSAARAGLKVETILVENESTAAERAAVSALPGFDRCIHLRGNRGYAAAVNAGLAVATAPLILVSNPDVEFGTDSVATLVATANAMRGAVGPRLTLDRDRQWLLPAASPGDPAAEWRRLAGKWSEHFRQGARRAAVAYARRLATATTPIDVPGLPGAVWCAPRAVWTEIGELDERYPLYFEETDWFRRAARFAVPIAIEPRAQVRHLFGRSGHGSEDAAWRFRVSARRYWRRHGSLALRWARLLLEDVPAPSRARAYPPAGETAGASTPDAVWALSPNADLIPAALALDAPPPEIEQLRRLVPAGEWFLGRVEADGRMTPAGRFTA